ncbi:MAG: threonine dehydratase [Gammaproteobacteria bacterium]|nr:threonine dehydratase [Gammaproteobacteria bacterium]
MKLPSLGEIENAAALIAPYVSPTPQYQWPLLSDRCKTEVWVKHENTTPIGSFKIRGGITYMADLDTDRVICATRGNHGQSVAYAARIFGMQATVVVPKDNSAAKNASMRAFGATLIEHGRDFTEAHEYAHQLADDQNLHFVPSFHHKLVVGVATCGLELLRRIPDLDEVYVPVGLGSEICAMIAVREALGLETKIIGVVADKAPAYALSFEKGQVVSTDSADTFADGVAVRVPDTEALTIMTQYVSRFIRVTEREIADAMRFYFTDTHHVIEGAGASSLAALIKDKARSDNRRAGVIASGGNVNLNLYCEILSGSYCFD